MSFVVPDFVKSLWSREPVRLGLYTAVVAPIAALLVARGIVDSDVVDIVLAAVASAFGISVTETVRSQVTPAA